MIRWKYVIPRAVVLAAFFCFLVFGANPTLKWLLIQSGQQVTGAKVEIRGVNVDWLDGKVQLTDIEIADPRQPMENMIQYQSATLDIDPSRFLQKEIVVEHAQIEQIQFGTPRTDPGNLEEDSYRMPTSTKWVANSFKQMMQDASQNWLDQFEQRALESVEENSQTVQVARRIHDQWTDRYKKYRWRAEQINQQLAKVKTVINEPRQNPLRDLERIQYAATEINSLQKQASQIRREIKAMDDQLERDRQALLRAQEQDEAFLRKNAAQHFGIDANKTSQLLLGEEQARFVGEMLQWLNWLHQTLPNPAEDFYPRRSRGEDIHFVGLQPRPRWLIEHAEISGRGMIGGNRYDFVGTAANLCSHPERCSHPTQLELQARGPQSVKIAATLDRRHNKKSDSIKILIPEMDIPNCQLGSPGSLMVDVSAGKLAAEMELQVIDGELRGKLTLQQSQFAMRLVQIHAKAGNKEMARRLNQQLAAIDQFKIEINLSGRRENLRAELTSDLGQKVADAFGQMMKRSVEDSLRQQKAQLLAVANREYSKLALRHQQEVKKLLGMLAGDHAVADLEPILKSGRNGLIKIR